LFLLQQMCCSKNYSTSAVIKTNGSDFIPFHLTINDVVEEAECKR
jgi:hypothetical protein